ncbi:MAG: 30S ribosomal protein S16 [Acidimicrobiia bacterium]|jgi:small subunit ribosomal protein S16
MAVKMRLMRMGKKKSPYYRVVVMDGRSPRDGRYIELIGRYDPRETPSVIDIDTEKAVDWLRKGAQPTDPVRKLLEQSGAWSRFKVVSGKVHTVGAKAPAAPAAAATEPAPPAVPEPVVAVSDEAPAAAVTTEEE